MGPIEQVIAALESAGVRYLVVGGVAVVLHGHLRTTADLDLAIDLEPGNARQAVAALSALGLRPRAPVPLDGFADAEQRRTWMQTKGLTVLSLWSPDHPAFEVDLFVAEPFDFDSAYRRSLRVRLDEVDASVLGLDDLIAAKLAVGRPQDLLDVEALRLLGASDDPRQGPS